MMNMILALVILVTASYCIGSICFGPIFAAIFKLPNLRSSGSGNIGATNVWRVGGAIPSICTLLFDSMKGALSSHLPLLWNESMLQSYFHFKEYNIVIVMLICGMSSVLGHIRPFLYLSGGKGVSTFYGALFTCFSTQMIFSGAIWICSFFILRVPAVASISLVWSSFALISVTIFDNVILWQDEVFMGLGVFIFACVSFLITYSHKINFIDAKCSFSVLRERVSKTPIENSKQER